MNSNKTREIPIVFISDDRYAMPTGVAITSLRLNVVLQEDVNYEVFVVSIGMSKDNQNRIKTLHAERFHINIIEYELNEVQKSIHSNNGSHVSVAAIVKFELANLLRQYHKILYLDSDIVVLKSIIELWNTDISEYYAAAVIDGASTNEGFQRHVRDLNLDPKQYFNSGVLLLNAKKIREDGICEILLDYRIHGKNFYMDQDALNVVFYKKVRFISPYYNLFNSWYRTENAVQNMSKLYNVGFDMRQGHVFYDAVILHFGDYRKPWNVDEGVLSGIFYSYYMLSPFNDCKEIRMKFAWKWSLPIYKKKFCKWYFDIRYRFLKYSGFLWLRKILSNRF